MRLLGVYCILLHSCLYVLLKRERNYAFPVSGTYEIRSYRRELIFCFKYKNVDAKLMCDWLSYGMLWDEVDVNHMLVKNIEMS